jgi:alpha-glucosidase
VADIKAVHLAQAERKPLRPAVLARTDPRRPPVRLTPDLGLAVAPDVRPDQAAVAALRLTVDTPRRVWLSDLAPASVVEEGAFGVVWPHRRDRDLDGQPIVLGGEVRAKGLTIHSKATLTWELAGAYVRLLALVGISDQLGSEGDCDVVISGDGRELWRRTSIRGGQAAIPVSLDLAGVNTLTILVDTGARYDIGDHLVLADAGLVRR